MNLAVVHYHLNRGGVTHVIANHLQALDAAQEQDRPGQIALLYGGRKEGWPERLPSELGLDVTLHGIPALDYDEGRHAQPKQLASQLKQLFGQIGFSPRQTVIHAHNHALGKNLSLPGALTMLAGDGYRLLLQIHDFAEDFRPENHRRLATALSPEAPGKLPSILYPQAEHIHYVVLNGRDCQILRRAGVSPSRLHLVPNPVSEFGTLPSKVEARQRLAARFGIPADCHLVLYPVRCIRRKNAGEALLWSALAGQDARVAITLPPLNPVERPSYSAWKRLAATLDLPCVFDVGGPGGLGFTENLAAADAILTTSVAEGFGMVFLEAPLAGRPLIGRDLPEITADFVAAGIRLDGLRPGLTVPLDWVGEDCFRSALEAAYLRAQAAYQQPPAAGAELGRDIDRLIDHGQVDFGILSSGLQRHVIQLVHSQADRRDRLLELNPWIARALTLDSIGASDTIRRNVEAVRGEFSLEVSGTRLLDLYRSLEASPRSDQVDPLPDGPCILDSFLCLSRFHPIRLGS